MPEWFEDLPGSSGATEVAGTDVSAWQDHAFADDIRKLNFVPITTSEMLLVAQHLPLTVRKVQDHFNLYADLRQTKLKRAPFDANGNWAFGYKPIALRLLPFGVSAAGEIIRIADTNPTQDIPRESQEIATLFRFLKDVAAGSRRLSDRTKNLVQADILRASESDPEAGLYATEMKDFDAVSSLDLSPNTLFLLCVLGFSHKNYREESTIRSLVSDRRNIAAISRSEKPLDFGAFLDFGTSLKF